MKVTTQDNNQGLVRYVTFSFTEDIFLFLICNTLNMFLRLYSKFFIFHREQNLNEVEKNLHGRLVVATKTIQDKLPFIDTSEFVFFSCFFFSQKIGQYFIKVTPSYSLYTASGFGVFILEKEMK